MKAYVMQGLPGSGKSTWIKNNLPKDIIVISRDKIRAQLGYTKSEDDKKVLSKEQETEVTKEEYSRIIACAIAGLDITIDDTNLRSEYYKRLFKVICDWYGKCTVIRIISDPRLCHERRPEIPLEFFTNAGSYDWIKSPSTVYGIEELRIIKNNIILDEGPEYREFKNIDLSSDKFEKLLEFKMKCYGIE